MLRCRRRSCPGRGGAAITRRGFRMVRSPGRGVGLRGVRLAVGQVTLPPGPRSTGLSGLGTSSVVSQNVDGFPGHLSFFSSGQPGHFGSSPFIAAQFDLPTIWMLPSGHSRPSPRSRSTVSPSVFWNDGFVRLWPSATTALLFGTCRWRPDWPEALATPGVASEADRRRSSSPARGPGADREDVRAVALPLRRQRDTGHAGPQAAAGRVGLEAFHCESPHVTLSRSRTGRHGDDLASDCGTRHG